MNFTYRIFVAKPEFFVGGSHTDSEDIELTGETFSDVEFDGIFDGGDDIGDIFSTGEMPLYMDITENQDQTTIFANSKFEGADDLFDEAIFGDTAEFIDIHEDF